MSPPCTSPSPQEIRAFRGMLGLSQAALAAELGSSTRAVEDWEAGRREPPAMLRLALSAVNAGLPPWNQPRSDLRHVYTAQPTNGGWQVAYGFNGEKMGQVFATRDEAISHARAIARNMWEIGSPAQVRSVGGFDRARIDHTYGADPADFG